MGEAILVQNIPQSSLAIPNADTAFYTNNIKSTEYNNVKIDSTVAIATTGTSTLQNINIKLKLNGATLITWVYKPAVAASGQIPLTLTYIGNSTTAGGLSLGGSLTLTASAAAADANTTITAINQYVIAVDS